MPANLKPGDRVRWNTSQGPTRGKVIKRPTAPAQGKGHAVKAASDNPEYLVESDTTGAKAAHKASAPTKSVVLLATIFALLAGPTAVDEVR